MQSRIRMFNFLKVILLVLFLFNCCAFAEEAEQQIMDFSLSGFGEKGAKTWDLAGRSADISTDLIKLKDVKGNFYGASDNVNLTAEEGDFNKKDARLHLEKNVVITTSSGAKLTTDSLNWDKKTQMVSTKDTVNIEKENLVAVASGATGKPDLNTITLEKDVTVEVNPAAQKNEPQAAPGLKGEAGAPPSAAKDKIVITCDGPVEIDYAQNIAAFNKNVKVQTNDSQIYSDTMDIYFAQSDEEKENDSGAAPSVMNSRINKIVSRGNVKIVRGENISYSDEATYVAADKKIVLSGAPKLILYSAGDLNAPIGN